MVFSSTVYAALVLSGTDKGASIISDMLPIGQFSPVTVASSGGEGRRLLLSTDYDIVIINTPLRDEFGAELALDLTQNTSAGVLLLVKGEQYDRTVDQVERAGVLTLPKPFSQQVLSASIRLMTATRERLRLLEMKNTGLREKIDEIRVVNHAKWLLIDRLGMNEADAHRYIEKQAMDTRISKRAAAEAIIHTHEG